MAFAYAEAVNPVMEQVLTTVVRDVLRAKPNQPLQFLKTQLEAHPELTYTVDDPEQRLPAQKTREAARRALEQAADTVSKTNEQPGDENALRWSAERWFRSLDLYQIFAESLCTPLNEQIDKSAESRSVAELAFMRELGKMEAGCRLCCLAQLITPAVATLLQTMSKGLSNLAQHQTAHEMAEGKFCEDLSEMQFGGLDDFNRGLDGLIGLPHPNLLSAMTREHCDSPSGDSDLLFDAKNYQTRTTSCVEWWFVFDPAEGKDVLHDKYAEQIANGQLSIYPVEKRIQPRMQRSERTLASFDGILSGVNARLRQLDEPSVTNEEVIGARLYTGPMFQKYNTVMRALGHHKDEVSNNTEPMEGSLYEYFKKELRGNRYATTIHVINSAILKLRKLTTVTTVYRGMQGRKLPKEFTKGNGHDTHGGVEFAFLSTTRDRKVAFSYAQGHTNAGSNMSIVLEIMMGMVDRGADLGWVSQYPHEQEILFNPLTALEVESAEVEQRVLVLRLRPSVNQLAMPIEKVVAKMQNSHVQLLDMMIETLEAQGLSQAAMAPLSLMRRIATKRSPSWYNGLNNYRLATDEALKAKQLVFTELTVDDTAAASFRSSRGSEAVNESAGDRAGVSVGERVSGDASDKANGGEGERTSEEQIAFEFAGFKSLAAERDFTVAELCASEEQVEAAVGMLLHSLNGGVEAVGGSLGGWMELQHPRLSADALRLAKEAMEAEGLSARLLASQTSRKGGGGVGRLGRRFDLHVYAVQMLLSTRAAAPWPETIVKLASLTEDDPLVDKDNVDEDAIINKVARVVVRLLNAHDLIPPREFDGIGSEVLALHQLELGVMKQMWVRGTIVRKDEVPAVDVAAKSGGDPDACAPEDVFAMPDTVIANAIATAADAAGARAAASWYVVQTADGRELRCATVLPVASDGGGVLLRVAAREDCVPLLGELLAAGVPVASADEEANTALHLAARRGHERVCKMLVAHGADAFLPNAEGECARDIAAMHGHEDARAAMAPSDADSALDAARDEACARDDLLLLREAFESQEKLLDRLKQMEAGTAELAQTASNGMTLLMVAASRGSVDVAAQLLRLKADLHAQMTESPKWGALHFAAESGHFELVSALLTAAVDGQHKLIDMRGEHGESALMQASAKSSGVIVKKLLDAKADANLKRTDVGTTALIAAAAIGDSEIVSALLESEGIDACAKDAIGMSALAVAAKFGRVDAVAKIGEHIKESFPSELDSRSVDGGTPLILASNYGRADTAHKLVRLGADVWARDRAGNTAAMLAAMRGHQLLLAQLLESHDETNEKLSNKNTQGYNALMLACMHGKCATAEMLAREMSDPLVCLGGTRGDTSALMLAAQGGHDDIVSVLIQEARRRAVDQQVRLHPTAASASLKANQAANGGANQPSTSSSAKSSTKASRVGSAKPREKNTTLSVDMARAIREEVQRRLDMQDADGNTALYHAARNGHAPCVRILLQANASRYLCGPRGETALMAAVQRGNSRVCGEFEKMVRSLERGGVPTLALVGKSLYAVEQDKGGLAIGGLLIDVGTGEMKLLALLQFDAAELHELAVIKMKDLAMKDSADAFLQSVGSETYKTIAAKLLSGIDVLVQMDWYQQVNWVNCFMGVTAWYRHMSADDKAAADVFINALKREFDAHLKQKKVMQVHLKSKATPLELEWQAITGSTEAQCEARAVEYAVMKSNLSPPFAVLAGGSGSVQITGQDALHSFKASLKDGEKLIESGERATQVGEWAKQVEGNFEGGMLTTVLKECANREPVRIVCMSGFFYAAVAAKIVPSKPSSYEYISAEHVVAKLQALCDDAANTAKDVANAMRLLTLLRLLFEEHYTHVSILFARDWKLPSQGRPSAQFRTTWTSGWWLDRVIEHHMAY